MSEISAEQVAHLANLARIALTDEEIEHLTAELGQIMHAVEKVSEVATPDVPPTSHPIPLQNVFRADVVGDNVLTVDAGARGRPRVRRLAVRRLGDPGGGAVSDLIRLTAAELGERLAAGEVSSVEATRAHLDRIAAVDGAVHAFLHVDGRARARDRRRHRPPSRGGRAARPARGRADRHQGRPRHRGHAVDRGLAHPRGLDPAVRRDPGAPGARGGHDPARQDQHGRVRHGLVDRALRVRPDPQPVGPRAHPRRFRRRLGGIRRAPSRRPSRSAATRAARSASPRTSPAPSASSPRTAP